MSKQPEALRLAGVFDAFDIPLDREAATELRRLHKVNKKLLKALNQIQHSVKQAQISGNDWRRDLALIQNITRAAITKAEG